MKILITSNSGNTKELLEKIGILADPSEDEDYFLAEIETIEDLFGLSQVLEMELKIKFHKKTNEPVIKIIEYKKVL